MPALLLRRLAEKKFTQRSFFAALESHCANARQEMCVAILQAVPGEENNMIVVPCWESNEVDTVLAALTDALLDIMGTLSADADVRRYTKAVEEAVALKVECPIGLQAQPANPEEVDLGDEDDCIEEEMQEHAIPAAQQSHLVMI